ncbi:MAG TPA: carboxypeptidase regulatory-like domain-containing protein [Bryobacteraceae bacterium]|nr:carboxypeptidase regulatory-like domain-containing protein [Bryobacteraceae bacterium]
MRRTLAVSLLALVSSAAVYAQAVVGSGAITGIVMDKYGDGIPETTVSLTNKTLGIKRTMLTTDDGIFNLSALVPGNDYDLKVTRRGYSDWELPSFDLAIGETVNFRIHLYADRPSTLAEAQRSIAPVQDSKISVSSTITPGQLSSLPTPAQQVDPLVLLAPAVVESPQGVLVFRGTLARNVFLLDGLSISDNYFRYAPNVAPFIAQESVDTMQVISGAATADFTHTTGGIVNAVSKSGVNRLHASAYDYYAKNSWDSPDFFGNGFVPSGRYNNGGVSVGVPIITDTLFLFGNLQHLNDSTEGLNRIVNPLLTTPDGSSVLTASCAATASQCQQAAYFINQQLNVKVPETNNSTTGFARMDFRPNDHENFTLSGAILAGRGVNNYNNATVSTNGGLLGSNANLTNSTRYGAFGWTHVLRESMVNDFHGGWFRDTMTTATDTGQFPVSSGVCLPCGTGPLGITVDGTPLGGNPAVPFNLRELRYQASDNFTFSLASHTVRIGADGWRRQDTMDQLYARFGVYNYDSLTAFAEDFSANVRALKNYSSFQQTLGTSVATTTDWFYSPFAEDTWQVKPGLTVNASVRWEKARLPVPASNSLGNYLAYTIPSPNTDVEPRFGLAYLLDHRTVVRIGGGSYYEPFPGQLLHDLYVGGGNYQSYYELVPYETGAVTYPQVLPSSAVNNLNTALIGAFYPAERFRNPYSIQADAAIERRLNRWVSLALSYLQSSTHRLWVAQDSNLVGSNLTSETYTVNNAQGTAVNTYTTAVWNGAQQGHHYEVQPEGGASYRAGIAQARTAPLKGFSLQVSYTWSHAYDDMSGPLVQNTIVPANYFPSSYVGDQGPSAFDQRNHGVANFLWQPVINKSDALSRFLLNGWLVSGIVTYGSTIYQTPLVDVIGQQFNVTNSVNTKITMDFPSSLNGTGGWSRMPLDAVNILPLGAFLNVDARVSKTVPFTSRLRGTFAFDAFNASNHKNISAVQTIGYTATLGVISPVAGLGTPVASYGYPFGSSARHVEVSFHLDW